MTTPQAALAEITPAPSAAGTPGPLSVATKTWLLIAALACTGGALAWWLASEPVARPVPSLSLPAAAAVLCAARLMQVPATFRRQTLTLSLGHCGTVLVLIFVKRDDLLPLATAVAIGHQCVTRREIKKAMFNVANNALAVGAAALVFDATVGPGPVASVRGWGGIAAAGLTCELLSTLMVLLVVHLQGAFDRRRLAAYLMPIALGFAVNVALSIVAVDALWTNRWSLAVLLAVPAGALVAHRSYTRLAGRYANLQALYGLTQRLAGLSEEQDVLREVLLGVEQALSCRRAQLVVLRSPAPLRYELRGDGVLVLDQLEEPPALVTLLSEGRAGGKGALLAPRRARGSLGEALRSSGLTDAMLVRLPTESGDQRVLVVGDRLGGGTFGRRDLPFLETLAAQCAVSLRGTRLADELRSEVASREYDALHDSLTGLGNRTLLVRRCEEALARRRPNTVVAVMLMGLDGFKEINDTLGYQVGDVVLQEVARRLRQQVGVRGVPTRLGGDEFAIVFPSVEPRVDLRAVARGIAEAVSRPMEMANLTLTVQASIGIALAPGHGVDTSALLKGADVAMYAAKAFSERIAVYNPSGDHHSTRRLLLASELRRAAETEELALHYQPKVDVETGAVLGFEALLRWSHASLGEVSPTEFIPVAEQAGLIDGMTWWVLAEALREQQRWAAAGHDLSVAVNISARSLLDGRLASRLSSLLASSGVPPDRLTLEVTETSVMADAERSAAILEGAASLGVRISVDDFGTGYSSLSRLLEMPVHEIKVDRSFVTTMLRSTDNFAIVSSTVNLALSMGRKVIAEGVEDRETLEALRALGCHAAQGYALARPMAPEQVLPWLATHEAAAWREAPAPAGGVAAGGVAAGGVAGQVDIAR